MPSEDPQFARNKTADLIGDCRLMLRHALKESLDLPADLQRDLTALDRELMRCKLATIGNASECLLGLDATTIPTASSGDTPPAAERLEPMALIYRVHADLSLVVAPATVGSLIATEPEEGKDKTIFRGLPKIVKAAAITAIVCAVGFVLTGISLVEENPRTIGSAEQTNGEPVVQTNSSLETNKAPANSPGLEPASSGSVNTGKKT